jgi:hypothetical protein
VKCSENNHQDNELRISCEEESIFLFLLTILFNFRLTMIRYDDVINVGLLPLCAAIIKHLQPIF